MRIRLPPSVTQPGEWDSARRPSDADWRKELLGWLWDNRWGEVLADDLYAYTDAYGPEGMIPDQGADWSGFRDSSDYALSRILALAWGDRHRLSAKARIDLTRHVKRMATKAERESGVVFDAVIDRIVSDAYKGLPPGDTQRRPNPRRLRRNPNAGERSIYRAAYRNAVRDRTEGRPREKYDAMDSPGWGTLPYWYAAGYRDGWEDRPNQFGLIAKPSRRPNPARPAREEVRCVVCRRRLGIGNRRYGWSSEGHSWVTCRDSRACVARARRRGSQPRRNPRRETYHVAVWNRAAVQTGGRAFLGSSEHGWPLEEAIALAKAAYLGMPNRNHAEATHVQIVSDRTHRAVRTFAVGGRERLNPSARLEETVMGRWQGSTHYGWTMVLDGKAVGDVTGWIKPDGTLRIGSIAAWRGARSLGVGAMRAFAREIRRVHPEVERFAGHHVGGWRAARSGTHPFWRESPMPSRQNPSREVLRLYRDGYREGRGDRSRGKAFSRWARTDGTAYGAGYDDGWHRKPNRYALPRGARSRRPYDVPRENPGTLDASAAKAWAKFHLKSAGHAQPRRMPWLRGMKPPAELGLLEGLEVGSRDLGFHPTERGPVLVTDAAMRRLFILSWKPLRLLAGRVKAVSYFPRSNSGKYDRSRGFRHEFGEGGRRPRAQWPQAYPRLKRRTRDGRVWELVDGEFTVEDRGIVG